MLQTMQTVQLVPLQHPSIELWFAHGALPHVSSFLHPVLFPLFFAGLDSRLQGDGWEIGAGSLISGVRSVKAGKSYRHYVLFIIYGFLRESRRSPLPCCSLAVRLELPSSQWRRVSLL